jgi:hypothetical protein
LHVEGGPAPDFGLEFHDLLLVVFIDVDIHRLLQKLWQIRDLDLSVGASKGLKIKLLYAHKAVPDTRGDLCAEDWLQVNAGYGYAEISACAVEVVALWALPDRGNCTSSVAKIRTVMERLRMVSV